MYTHGFSLLELLITLVVLAIMLALGAPSFANHIHNNQVKVTTLSLLEAVAFTRNQAVFNNRRVTLRNPGRWEDGWEIFLDTNNNGIRDQDERLLISRESIQNVRITPNQPVKHYISYIGSGESRLVGNENGGAFQAGTIRVCPTGKGGGYELTLARSGRLRMSEINATQCADSKNNQNN